MVKNGISLIVAFTFSLGLWAQIKIEGRVSDIKGNGIFSASVCLKQLHNCCTYTDLQGCFSLLVPETTAEDTLLIRFIGYESKAIPLKGTVLTAVLQIKLKEDNRLLSTAIIEHNPRLSEEFSLQKVDKMDIYLSPVSDGDPLKAVSFLPASSNTSENANPEFRGSQTSASQVLLNGVAISAPVRNTQLSGMGNFSLFNTELIGDMTVYAGNPPLTLGNALAGLVEINTCTTIEKNQTQLAVSMANVGIYRAQQLGKTAFVQVYANHQFSEPYLFFNPGGNKIKSFQTNDIGMNFRWNWKSAFLNVYSYGIDEYFKAEDYAFGKKAATTAHKRRQFNVLNLGWHKGRCFVEINSGNNYSKSDFSFGILRSKQTDREWKSTLNLKYLPIENLMLQTGISADYMSLDFTTDKPVYAFSLSDSVPMLHTDTSICSFIPEAFLYARLHLPGQITLGLGARKNLLFDKLPSYLSFQANLRWRANHRHSLLLSGGQYNAGFYPIYRFTRFSLQTSRQLSIEYTYSGEKIFIQTAAYKKSEQAPIYYTPEYSMTTAQKDIKGLECSIEYEWKNIRSSLSYTLLNAAIKMDSIWHKAENDLPCFLKAYFSFTTKQLLNISCSGVFRPGLWYTPLESGQYIPEAHAFEPQYGAFNSLRYNPYCKIDLGVNQVFFGKKQRTLVIFASLSNVLNRKNQKGWIYTPDYSLQAGSFNYQARSYYLGAQLSF